MQAENVMDVQPSLSREFCIGLHDMRYFIGIPRAVAGWFLDLPWACAAISSLNSSLMLACRDAEAPGLTVPAFSLSFDVRPAGYTKSLAHYHYLDVRITDPVPNEPSAFRISREVHATLPIRVVSTPAALRALVTNRAR